MDDVAIRPFEKEDEKAIWRCVEKLQEHLVNVDRWNAIRVADNDFLRKYISNLLQQIEKEDGMIFVAESEGEVIGFVAGVIKRYTEDDVRSCLFPSVNDRVLELFVDERS